MKNKDLRDEIAQARRIRDSLLARTDWKLEKLSDLSVQTVNLSRDAWVHYYVGARPARGAPSNVIELIVVDEQELMMGWDDDDNIWLSAFFHGAWEDEYFGQVCDGAGHISGQGLTPGEYPAVGVLKPSTP